MKSDIEIARSTKGQHITKIASAVGVPEADLMHYGSDKAKLNASYIDSLSDREDGKLILVTAITPTPAGEGKTTTSVGLGDGLGRIGKKAMICLREPSLGPCFGMKGGAAGGGYAQVIPMEDINLHFTGDFHAITSAHNLLSAMIDNHIHWGNQLNLDSRKIEWRRVVDLNDRALRDTIVGMGGTGNGYTRQTGFDITVASEVMAILCLSNSLKDMEEKLGNITIGYNKDKKPVLAKELNANKAMSVLLKNAILPNLTQTLEGNPSFIHGGPFANIAHGCNSILATKTAMKLSDYVVTEAGFGADLGAEKFMDIKCRKAGIKPSIGVLVATVRALKLHGGLGLKELSQVSTAAVEKGLVNLERHIENLQKFGIPVVVAINHFVNDDQSEIDLIKEKCAALGVEVSVCKHWALGGEGTTELAQLVVDTIDQKPANFRYLYEDSLSLWEKTEKICKEIYRADKIDASPAVKKKFEKMEQDNLGHYPICMAKTQYSFSADPKLIGAPTGHTVTIKDVKPNTGAEFVVVVCGDIMRMPGLPKVPAAEKIFINDQGLTEGLF